MTSWSGFVGGEGCLLGDAGNHGRFPAAYRDVFTASLTTNRPSKA